MILPGEFRLLMVILTLCLVIGSQYITRKMQNSIHLKYNKRYVAYRRRTNPCYHCPRPRKYVCDGCYVRLRKEYEDGNNGSEKHG